jgi:hypothetical protein
LVVVVVVVVLKEVCGERLVDRNRTCFLARAERSRKKRKN